MNRNLNTLFFILGLIAVITGLIFLSSYAKNKEITKGIEERKAKNALDTLIMYSANRHAYINESLRGKVVVLNVWNTAFGPGMAEIPELNKLVLDFNSDKVVFLALNEGDAVEEGKRMVDERIVFDYKLSYSEGPMINMLYLFKLPTENVAVPLNVVLNPQGHIEFYSMGNQPEDLKKISEYLQKETK